MAMSRRTEKVARSPASPPLLTTAVLPRIPATPLDRAERKTATRLASLKSFGGGELRDLVEPAEAPLAAMEFRHRGAQLVGAEVRPQGVEEAELRIGGFPQQEIRQPFLAAGADQEIDVCGWLSPAWLASSRPKASREGACAASQRAAASVMASRAE